jgi:hypothetical protein
VRRARPARFLITSASSSRALCYCAKVSARPMILNDAARKILQQQWEDHDREWGFRTLTAGHGAGTT